MMEAVGLWLARGCVPELGGAGGAALLCVVLSDVSSSRATAEARGGCGPGTHIRADAHRQPQQPAAQLHHARDKHGECGRLFVVDLEPEGLSPTAEATAPTPSRFDDRRRAVADLRCDLLRGRGDGASSGLPDVLRGATFHIGGGEKIGVCGRTGSGKSTLLQCLFRMVELRGRITIDDVDIRTVPLPILRSRLAIIPQDPIFFTGTLRYNLDPNDEFTDEELRRALEQCALGSFVQEHSKASPTARRRRIEHVGGQRQPRHGASLLKGAGPCARRARQIWTWRQMSSFSRPLRGEASRVRRCSRSLIGSTPSWRATVCRDGRAPAELAPPTELRNTPARSSAVCATHPTTPSMHSEPAHRVAATRRTAGISIARLPRRSVLG